MLYDAKSNDEGFKSTKNCIIVILLRNSEKM